MTGILGVQWTLSEFHPMGDVPAGVKPTSYSGEASDISAEQQSEWDALIAELEADIASQRQWYQDHKDDPLF